MPRLRKLRKRQKFQYNRNRKRVQKTQEKTKNANVKINCDVLKENWDGLKPIKQNLTEMGLAFDANKTLSSSKSTKRLLIDRAKGKMPQSEEKKKIGAKLDTEVVQQLEKEADEAMAVAKSQKYRFPKEEVRWMTDMMDRYGDDFKAMAKDPKNLFQLTPNQIKQKIVKFINIPEQFASVAKERGLLEEVDAIASCDE